MTSLDYYNNIVTINDIFAESHKNLIEKVCIELGCEDKVEELLEKFLDTSIKLKAKRDPNKPRRPKNSYTFFCNDKRPKVKEDNPNFKFAEVNKKLGKMWKECKSTERDKYIVMGNLEKSKYKEDMEEYETIY
jgi:hypothetical protein